MSTVIRNQISKSNPYYISKHRYLELKHFCLQYPEWKEEYKRLLEKAKRGKSLISVTEETSDKTADIAVRLSQLSSNMDLVKGTADMVDKCLGYYIFRAVTEDRSYPWLRGTLNIPCCKNVYYQLYRKFWWILSQMR